MMMQLDTRLAKVRVLGVVALAMLFAASTANAGTRQAYGVGGIQNPSVAGANTWERGPIPVTTSLTVDGTGPGLRLERASRYPQTPWGSAGGDSGTFPASVSWLRLPLPS
jgi:hypothetical protein